MRYTVLTDRGPVEADIIRLTVGRDPDGRQITIPGYASLAQFERKGDEWVGTITTPGRVQTKIVRLNVNLTKDVVQIYGGRALVHYIEQNAIPLRTGKLPVSEPARPVDRDAPYRTGRATTYRRTRYGRMRKNHNGFLGAVWDTLVDIFWE